MFKWLGQRRSLRLIADTLNLGATWDVQALITKEKQCCEEGLYVESKNLGCSSGSVN